MKAITVSSMPQSRSATSAPSPADGQRRDDGQRMREALVEHAEHDVDGDQRGEDEQRLHAGLLLEGLGVAGRLGADGVRHPQLGDRLADGVLRLVRAACRRSGRS